MQEKRITLRDGRLVSWDDSGVIRLFDESGEACLCVMQGHSGAVLGVLALQPGDRLLSWSQDGTLRIWASDGAALLVLKGHTGAVLGAVLLPDGKFLSWSDDSTIRLWSQDGQPLAVLEGHTGPVKEVIVLKDGRVVSWSDDRTAKIWNAETGACEYSSTAFSSPISSAELEPDGRVKFSCEDGQSHYLDPMTGELLKA